jgi:predicted dehydrogenase
MAALASTGFGFNALGLAAEPAAQAKVYRAAVIGRTGGGDYGHGYDQVFKGVANVTVGAIAEHDAAGLQKAAERSGAKRLYLDYHEMLEKEKPDLVAIASRHPDCHKDMALAALAVSQGIFIEKPFTESVAEADDILVAAERRNAKIIVAHNRRYTMEFVQIRSLLERGLIGQVREVHIQGKQDSRVGGEDMLVLGTHDFDLMRFYFGDPQWCLASVTVDGHDLGRKDIHRGQEPILVGGDTIHAMFAFANNVMVHWSSEKKTDHWNTNFTQRERWAFEIYGTKGILAYQSGLGMVWLDSPFLAHIDDGVKWMPLPRPADWSMPAHASHPIKSLIRAIETNAQPACSGYDGRWAVEMVAAVYESQRSKGRIGFPLADREDPLMRY